MSDYFAVLRGQRYRLPDLYLTKSWSEAIQIQVHRVPCQQHWVVFDGPATCRLAMIDSFATKMPVVLGTGVPFVVAID